ncbi:MAG TPA: FAD-binding protein [Xanthomonadales bacterium]|nr:FAD-binding protein [Xanthomonadales bacterium]
MSRTLIVAEHDGHSLNLSTAKCLSCALAIGGDIDIVVLGQDVATVSQQAAALAGVQKVIAVDAAHLAQPLAVNWAPEIISLAASYSHLLGPSTTLGKDLMPRVAALAGVGQLSDVMEVLGTHSFRRPIYAGNAIIDVVAAENTQVVMTVRIASWHAAAEGGSAVIEQRPATGSAASHTRYVGIESAGGERPDLQSAARVVSGGRALGSAENFQLIYRLADKLGAGVGASRAAVDAGYVPNDMQVGQTGKIISPDLYLAFGISGAIQHVTGIKDAGTIVAVNKDGEAPIFEVADIGMVGDLFTIIPELERLL